MVEVGLESKNSTSSPVLHTSDESVMWENQREQERSQYYKEGLRHPLLMPKRAFFRHWTLVKMQISVLAGVLILAI